jgi:hypothetical protein
MRPGGSASAPSAAIRPLAPLPSRYRKLSSHPSPERPFRDRMSHPFFRQNAIERLVSDENCNPALRNLLAAMMKIAGSKLNACPSLTHRRRAARLIIFAANKPTTKKRLAVRLSKWGSKDRSSAETLSVNMSRMKWDARRHRAPIFSTPIMLTRCWLFATLAGFHTREGKSDLPVDLPEKYR